MMEQVTVSFPGLGIGEFDLNKIAFTLFGKVEIRWYGIIITMGIMFAVAYCAWRAKEQGISYDNLMDMALYTVIFGVIGARAYYVLMTLSTHSYKSFLDVIAIWEGGLAIYGGIIAGLLTIYFFCRIKKINPMKAFDMAAPAVMIGQFMGRWGNFFNGEAYGAKVAEGSPLYFLRMGLISSNTISDFGTSQMVYVHPTFLYESVWNVVGFVLINLLYRKRKFDGQITLMYFTWYGFGRMFIEGLRTDSLYLGVFRVSQVLGFVFFVTGSILLVLGFVKAHRRAAAGEAYEPCYAKCTGKVSILKKEEQTASQDETDQEIASQDEVEEKTEETKDGTEN